MFVTAIQCAIFRRRKKLYYPTALNFLEVQNSKLNLANWTLETPHDLEMFSIVTSHVRNISRLPRSFFSARLSKGWYFLRENRRQSGSQNYYKLSFFPSYKWLRRFETDYWFRIIFWRKHFRSEYFFLLENQQSLVK